MNKNESAATQHTIRGVPQDVWTQLRIAALAHHVSLGKLVTEILGAWLRSDDRHKKERGEGHGRH